MSTLWRMIIVQMFMRDLKKVSALERFCYKGFLRNSSGTKFFVRLREVSALGRLHGIIIILTLKGLPDKQNPNWEASYWMCEPSKDRSSCPEVFYKIAKFTEKHLYKSLWLRPATLLKKRPWHRCFPVNFEKLWRIHFLKNTPSGCFSVELFFIDILIISFHIKVSDYVVTPRHGLS